MSMQEVHLAGIDDHALLEALLETFEGLEEGSAVQLQFVKDPRSVLESFQERAWGRFTWFLLIDGPDSWSAVLSRTPEGAVSSSIAVFFTFDHRRCDALFAEMEQAARSSDLEGTKRLFSQFEVGLLHHFDMEEKGFFALFRSRHRHAPGSDHDDAHGASADARPSDPDARRPG